MMILPGEMGYFGDRAFSGGGGDGATKGRVSALILGTSLTAGVPKKITFEKTPSVYYYDELGELSVSDRFEPASSGYYDMHLLISTQAPAGNTRDEYTVYALFNGADVRFATVFQRSVSDFNIINFNYSLSFAATVGDYIELEIIYQNISGAGTTASIRSTSTSIVNFNKL